MRFISLFSGCGGFDKGFIDSGFNCLGAYDIDPIVVDVYNRNIGHHAKVWDLSKGTLPESIDTEVDVVIAGSPCQGFSTVGKRRVEDARNELLLVSGKIAIQLKAKYIIAENVMGSVSGDHRSYWDVLTNSLTNNGYQVMFHKVDITKLGLPQLRKRVIMIATKATCPLLIQPPDFPMSSLRATIEAVENLPNHELNYLPEDSKDFKIASRILPGQKLSNVRGGNRSVHTWDIPDVFGIIDSIDRTILLEIMSQRRKRRKRLFGDADPVLVTDLQSSFSFDIRERLDRLIKIGYLKIVDETSVDLVHTFNGKYRRLSYDSPSPTVDTRFGNPRYFLHPDEHRAITVREAARIQGFPDDFIFYGNKAQQFRMIGNAVPPNLSRWIAHEIKNNILQLHE